MGDPSRMMQESPVLADAAQRFKALDPRSSFHLEAPAGSGKTFLLTARFMRLLGLVDHPQQILALTFTNKASGEMRERISNCLQRVRSGHDKDPSNELEGELFHAARKALLRHDNYQSLLIGGEYLRIQTFHSFCYSLVTQAPLEAGITPGSTLLVEPDQFFFLREVIDRTLLEISKRDSRDPWCRALENRLLYLNNSWPLLVRELEDLMGRREMVADLVNILDRQRTADYVLTGVRELVEGVLGALNGSFRHCTLGSSWCDFLEDLDRHGAEIAGALPPEVPGSSWENLPQWRSICEALLTKTGSVRKQFGPSTGFYSGFSKTEWRRCIEDLDDGVVEGLRRIRQLPFSESAMPDLDSLWDLILLLHAVMAAYDDRCRKQRVLDFPALEMAALRLLESTHPSDLQLLLDHQIHHILIDEFQDTNYQQWSLLQKLCTGWAREDARTLFVVGDPKQSIYGFRKAEVRLFLEAQKGLPLDEFRHWPLECLVLQTNFRSQPHLIDWCNELFGRTVMAEASNDLDEVPFIPSSASPMTEVREPCHAPEAALFLAFPDATAARRREAAWMAQRVREELNDQGSSAEVGILLFTRTHLPVYLEALQQWGIAVKVTEGLKLADRPEVQYLWQLCRALVFPQDDLAWASQLRSPWLPLTYKDLLTISLEAPEPWIEKIREHASRHVSIGEFWENLRTARQHLGHEPLADVLEEAWLNLGAARTMAERWSSRGLAACRQFFEMVRQAEVHEPVQTVTRLEQLLQHAYEAPDPDTMLSNVSLMTIHRAKGLEFDTVFLPFLDWNPVARERMERPPYLLQRVPGLSDRYLLAARPNRRHGEPDPLYNWLHRVHVDRRWGEAKRLFYVALTRARRRLLMSGVIPWRDDASPSIPGQTPLAWLDSHHSIGDAVGLKDFSRPDEDTADVLPEWRVSWESMEGDFRIILEPGIETPLPTAGENSPVPIHPAPFERERPLFHIQSPSGLVEKLEDCRQTGDCSHGSGLIDHRLWGILIHRLLENYGKNGVLPPLDHIVSYLKVCRVEEMVAVEAARSAVSEVEACIGDPWLQKLYAVSHEMRWVEWPMESLQPPRTLYVGAVDLMVCIDGEWYLVDFKTSRPLEEEDVEVFCRRELEKYRPQLVAYREMITKAKGLQRDAVQAGIYWTALRRWKAC